MMTVSWLHVTVVVLRYTWSVWDARERLYLVFGLLQHLVIQVASHDGAPVLYEGRPCFSRLRHQEGQNDCVGSLCQYAPLEGRKVEVYEAAVE